MNFNRTKKNTIYIKYNYNKYFLLFSIFIVNKSWHDLLQRNNTAYTLYDKVLGFKNYDLFDTYFNISRIH